MRRNSEEKLDAFLWLLLQNFPAHCICIYYKYYISKWVAHDIFKWEVRVAIQKLLTIHFSNKRSRLFVFYFCSPSLNIIIHRASVYEFKTAATITMNDVKKILLTLDKQRKAFILTKKINTSYFSDDGEKIKYIHIRHELMYLSWVIYSILCVYSVVPTSAVLKLSAASGLEKYSYKSFEQ